MALNDYPILINLSTGETVRDFYSNVSEPLAPITQGDRIRLLISGVRPNPNVAADASKPWAYADLPTTLSAGIGIVGSAPNEGTFTLTFGANTTTELAYNASASAVAAALNALASIISAGGVAVTGNAGGPYRVVFNSVGARDALTGSGDSLFPSTDIAVYVGREGTIALKEIQTIVLERNPDAYTDVFTDFPAAAVEISTLQGGGADVPEIQRIHLDPLPYGGSFALTFDGETTRAIAYDAPASVIQAALEELAAIGAGNVVVSGAFPIWDVSYLEDLTGDQAELTASAAGLLVPTGKIGVLDLATEGIAALLAGVTETEVTLEIEESTEPVTILHETLTLINDLIPTGPRGPVPLRSWSDFLFLYGQRNPGYWTALTGGGATSLDGVNPDEPGMELPDGHCIRTCVNHKIEEWELTTSAAAEDADGGVVAPDSGGSRRWIRRA